jgi:hypothetical protein
MQGGGRGCLGYWVGCGLIDLVNFCRACGNKIARTLGFNMLLQILLMTEFHQALSFNSTWW